MQMSTAKLRSNLSEAINRAAYGGERIVLKRRGKSVAAIVPIDDVELLEELENEADIRAVRKARKEKGGVPLEKIKARLGMK